MLLLLFWLLFAAESRLPSLTQLLAIVQHGANGMLQFADHNSGLGALLFVCFAALRHAVHFRKLAGVSQFLQTLSITAMRTPAHSGLQIRAMVAASPHHCATHTTA